MAPQQPEQYEDVQFDLATVTRPASEGNAKPFKARLAAADGTERVVEFTDPATLAWQDALEIDNPVMFLRYCVSDTDRDFIRELRMEGWQFNQLIERFLRHYKIDVAALRAGKPRL